MSLKTVWKNYRFLIVMGTSLAMIHWGWYNIKSSEIFKNKNESYIPEPGIVTHIMQQENQPKRKQ